MALTLCQQAQANLDLLNGLMVGGIARITHADKTVEYRAASRADLIREREYWQRIVDKCNGTAPCPPRRRFINMTPGDE